MKPFRRFVGLVLATVLVTAACQGSDEDDGAAPPDEDGTVSEFSLENATEPYRGTTIRVLDEITDLQPNFYENVVAEFEEITGITVDWELQGHFDVITVGEADLFSGRGEFDAIMLHRQQLPNALQANSIEFLNPYLEDPNLRDPSVEFSDFTNISDEATQFGENRICFDNWPYNLIWVGRSDLLEHPDEQAAFRDAYGYELAVPETLQQMRDIAEFFTRGAGEELAGETLSEPVYGFVQDGARLSVNWQDVWMNYILQWGGDLFAEDGSPTANLPENVEALEFWVSMFDFAPPGAGEITLLDIPVIVGQGRVASAIAWGDFFFTLDSPGGSAVAGDLVYAPIPANADLPDNRSASVTPSCLVINAASQNKEATYLFLQWIASQETQDAYLSSALENGTGFLPVLRASYDNPEFASGQRASHLAAIAGSLDVGSQVPLHRDMLRAADAMLQRFQEALLGQRTPAEAMDALQQDLLALCESDCLVTP